ncbi:MAG TPA: hypothetical protein VGQ96_04545, partial [Candidatus Eremiobacteraceae bacterium]|nr:hypothetical protein [Candidatus Eremiobacteraceae bacterium]
IAALNGDARKGAQLAAFADAKYKELGEARESTEAWSYKKLMASLNQQLDKATLEALAAEAALWTAEQAVSEALAVVDVSRRAA